MNDAPHIRFVLDPRATAWGDLERLDESDIARAPWRFVGGRNSWIAQSFLRLRSAIEARGWRASAGAGALPGTISIVHRDDMNRFAGRAHASYLVVVRADRAPVVACDLAIAQNALRLARNERFVPLWPQPGLMPRNASRGTRVECIAYHGRTGTSPAWFTDTAFRRGLTRRNVRFEVREKGWERYTDVDVALAVREELPGILATKPATKIYNGWLSGVAVLASPEPAYRELRRAPLDFLEVGGPEDLLDAVDLLQANPELYLAMLANGSLRAREFSVESIRARWLELLEGEVVPSFEAARHRLASRRRWFLAAMARQKIASRVHRSRLALEHLAGLRAVAT
ncbi:MAG: glycosyltransferase [Usitatibacter sp.]